MSSFLISLVIVRTLKHVQVLTKWSQATAIRIVISFCEEDKPRGSSERKNNNLRFNCQFVSYIKRKSLNDNDTRSCSSNYFIFKTYRFSIVSNFVRNLESIAPVRSVSVKRRAISSSSLNLSTFEIKTQFLVCFDFSLLLSNQLYICLLVVFALVLVALVVVAVD